MSRSSAKQTIPRPNEPLAVSRSERPRCLRWLFGGYFALMLIGLIVMRSSGSMIRGNEMSIEKATFTVINAATLTGFQQPVPLDDYGAMGQACVMMLTVGGMLFALMVGGLAVARIARMPYSDGQVIAATLFSVVFITGCGMALVLEQGRGLFASGSQVISALANSGLYLGRLPGANDWRMHLPLMPIAMIGGLSIPVVMEIADWVFKRQKVSAHTSATLTGLAVVYLVGWVALIPWGPHLSGADVIGASVMSVNARTCGFPTDSVGATTRVAQWMLVLLMLIGAGSGGTAGGMKVTTLWQALRGVRGLLNRQATGRVTGIAIAGVAIYLAIVFVALLALLGTVADLPGERLVFLAASAVGNVGLSHDPISIIGPGMYVLSGAMLVGRIAPLLILWWCATTCDDADIAVG